MRAFSFYALSACLFAVTMVAPAGAIDHRWSASYGDGADQVPTSVALDNAGNVLVLGHFNGTIDFGGGPIVAGGPADETFLARLGAGGTHVWSRSLGDSLQLGTGKLAVDGSGNALVALEFRGTVDCGGGPITAQGFRDGVIAKYDAAGNHLWSRNFGGPSAFVIVKAAGVDAAGNLLVAGTFTGDIDFGGTILTYTFFTTNMFVVKFNPAGAHLWSRKFTGGLVEITAITGDTFGNTIVTGYHGAAFDFGGGALDAALYDIFLAKYGPTGNHLWSQSYGADDSYEYAFDVATDGAGSVFITGHFNDTLDLGGGAMTTAGGWDMYLAKFDNTGAHVWSQRFGDSNTQRSYTVAVDGSGNVSIGGHFFGVVDFGGGALVADPIDFCVARFDGQGVHQWSRRLDVFNLGLQNDKPYAIAGAANAFGDMAFVGSFKDAVDCGGGDLTAGGAWDAFIVGFSNLVTSVRNPEAGTDTARLYVYPNPFNPRTAVDFSVRESSRVRLSVYDVSGRRVRTLVDRAMSAGDHTVSWEGRDDRGRGVASGVYFLRLETHGDITTRRIVLLK